MDKTITQANHQINRVYLQSLGCPKATVDSERILNLLCSEYYCLVEEIENADLTIINTCGFINDAIDESLAAIGEALNCCEKVIVTGCLGKRAELILEKYPNVLAITGPHQEEEVLNLVQKYLPISETNNHTNQSTAEQQLIKLTPRHYAYLKISEGCNHSCSFCIIPNLRGTLVSRTLNEIYQEAKILVASGCKELIIVSQDTAAYGLDKRYRTDFVGGRAMKTNIVSLCQLLSELGVWIRLHYIYPYPMVDQLIPLMAEGKILPYLDMPLQHASSKILKAMRRPAGGENILKRIAAWREICPTLTIRSSFICGFPGETNEDFEKLLDFLDIAQLDRVGAFAYSPVDGAAANQLADLPNEDIRLQRRERLLTHQADISADKLSQRIDQTVEVIIDEVTDEGTFARSSAEAPEVDGQIIIYDYFAKKIGERLLVNIVDSDTHDLIAEVV